MPNEQLQQELDESKRQVTISQKARERLEDDLRQVFLRGVSAMNIEALTLFNSNHKTTRDGRSEGDPFDGQGVYHSQSSSQIQASLSSSDEDEMQAGDSSHRSYSDSWGSGDRADWSQAIGPAADAETEQASPEVLTQQPTPREDLDAKLKAMLATSTSRLETSLNSNRAIPDNRSTSSPTVGYKSSNTPQHAPRPQTSSFHRSSSIPSANLLRSAEMVQQHMYGAPPPSTALQNRGLEASLAFQAPLSFNKPKPKQPTPSAKYQVEMEYIRSTVAAGQSFSTSSSRPRAISSSVTARSPGRSSSSSRFKM